MTIGGNYCSAAARSCSDGPVAPALVRSRISETSLTGAKVLMCENTMAGRKKTRDDMLPDIGYVKAGVVEIIDKQKQGWAVVRP